MTLQADPRPLEAQSSKRGVIAHIPSSHLDLFWLGTYKTCLARGADIIRQYLDRCLEHPDETFLLESVVFADYFLQRHPAYCEPLVRLVSEGRVEVGAAYIDRWENLILGESHIRNIQIGKRWCREALGIDNRMVTHPDLPGLVAQIAQIYTQAGLRYYVTSRKVYEHGAVWRYRSPDGSSLLMLNYPRHYIYPIMDDRDVPPGLVSQWTPHLNVEASLDSFPLGKVPVAAGAGDLTDRETFRARYGRYLEEFVAANRARYPDLDFTYTLPSKVLAPYEQHTSLPEHAGEVPSVWGVAADEEVAFFQRDRELEGLLLTAESLAVAAEHLGIDWRPVSADTWQGVFYEQAFFAPKDPIAPGRELDELWRMHVFTQDHNGGGQEGALSTFLKRVMQERCQVYARELLDHALTGIAAQLEAQGEHLIVFNPHGEPWSGPVAVTLTEERWDAGERVIDDTGRALATQIDHTQNGYVTMQIDAHELPALGYRAFAVGRAADDSGKVAVETQRDGSTLTLRSRYLDVAVNLHTGNLVRVVDRDRDQDWGGSTVGQLRALREVGNDVTLRMDPSTSPVEETFVGVDEVEAGPLFSRVRIRKQLLGADVIQTITVWAQEPRLDLQTRIRWWGKHHQQIRLSVPKVADADAIAYGSPFHGGGWTEVVEGAAPRNPDEILVEDYPHYREVQGWLHLRGDCGGLTICTSHPAWHHDADGLEAVLLRTSPSCGDPRYFWENAGEQVFNFVALPGDVDWRVAEAPRKGLHLLKPPVSGVFAAAGGGPLPVAQNLLRVEGSSALLSSLAPGSRAGTLLARIYDATGAGGVARLNGPLATAAASAVDLMEEQPEPLAGQPGAWQVELKPWQIRTIQLVR